MNRNCPSKGVLIMLILLKIGVARAQHLEEAAQEIANQISSSLIAEGKHNIALLPFTDLGNTVTRTGEVFSEELYNRLFRLRQGKFEIIERNKVPLIWKEQRDFRNLTEQWYIENMRGFSEILGADAILVGTLFEWDGYLRINARLIAVPTGRLFAAASTRMQVSSSGSSINNQGREVKDAASMGFSTTLGQVTYSVSSVEHNGQALQVWFLAKNDGANLETRISFESSLTDGQGVEHRTSERVVGQRRFLADSTPVYLPHKVGVRFGVFFDTVPPDVSLIPYIRIRMREGWIEFRDIPVPYNP